MFHVPRALRHLACVVLVASLAGVANQASAAQTLSTFIKPAPVDVSAIATALGLSEADAASLVQVGPGDGAGRKAIQAAAQSPDFAAKLAKALPSLDAASLNAVVPAIGLAVRGSASEIVNAVGGAVATVQSKLSPSTRLSFNNLAGFSPGQSPVSDKPFPGEVEALIAQAIAAAKNDNQIFTANHATREASYIRLALLPLVANAPNAEIASSFLTQIVEASKASPELAEMIGSALASMRLSADPAISAAISKAVEQGPPIMQAAFAVAQVESQGAPPESNTGGGTQTAAAQGGSNSGSGSGGQGGSGFGGFGGGGAGGGGGGGGALVSPN